MPKSVTCIVAGSMMQKPDAPPKYKCPSEWRRTEFWKKAPQSTPSCWPYRTVVPDGRMRKISLMEEAQMPPKASSATPITVPTSATRLESPAGSMESSPPDWASHRTPSELTRAWLVRVAAERVSSGRVTSAEGS